MRFIVDVDWEPVGPKFHGAREAIEALENAPVPKGMKVTRVEKESATSTD
jgi:hypothetical protein